LVGGPGYSIIGREGGKTWVYLLVAFPNWFNLPPYFSTRFGQPKKGGFPRRADWD